MIQPEEITEQEQPQEPPELTVENMRAICHLALVGCGGIMIPQELLDSYPEDAKIEMSWDMTNKLWKVFAVTKKPKRGKIIKKDRSILVPSDY